MTPNRVILVFDGDCQFCRRSVACWRRYTKGRVLYLPYQKLGERFPEIDRAACEHGVQLLEPDGRVYSGADGVVRLFGLGLPGGKIARAVLSRPPIIWALRLGYGYVARNRSFISRLVRRQKKGAGRL